MRIRWLLRQFKLSQTELAQRLGYGGPAYVSNIVNAHKGISRPCAERINEAFGIDLTWLLTGQGSPWGRGPTTTEGPRELVRVIVAPERWYCGNCGHELHDPEEQTCEECGSYLDWPEGMGRK